MQDTVQNLIFFFFNYDFFLVGVSKFFGHSRKD